jgi:hypothetical protein
MLRPALPLLLLAACEGGTDLDLAPDVDPNDGGYDGIGYLGVQCDLDPAPEYAAASLRVGPDGTLWHLDALGRVTRYERAPGDDCVLTGDVVTGVDDFTEVMDLELDDDGNVYTLVYFDEVRRLAPDGAPEFACEVEAGHALAPSEDGAVVHVWPIGAESLAVVDVTDGSCAERASPLALPLPVGTSAVAHAGRFAGGPHDAGDHYPPGVLLDLSTGAEVGAFPEDAEYGGESLSYILDIAARDDGWWISDGGALWQLDGDGDVLSAWDLRERLPVAGDDDPWLSVEAIAWRTGQPFYVAAGDVGMSGIWEVGI